MISDEQASAIKKQLIEHIQNTFPEDKKHSALQEVEKMDSQDLEDFLVKNNLVSGQNKNQECIFCSIIFGDIPSYKIEENEYSLAILEINPISKGHSIVISKKHLKEGIDVPKETEKLAKKIAKKIKAKLKPKRVDVLISGMFGHHVINVLPVYDNETLSSKRSPAKKEELEEIEKMLKTSSKSKIKKDKTKKEAKPKEKPEVLKKEKLWLPQRIP